MSNNATTHSNRKATLSPAEEAERLEALLRHLEQLLPENREERAQFRKAIAEAGPLCVRLNRLVPAHADAIRPSLQAAGESVEWCADAFVLADREPHAPLGNTLECALGAVYVQAKATTLAAQVLDPQPGEKVLDLAAAPGGKATHIASLMDNEGLLIANEPRQKRMSALVGNLERCGAHHTVLTSLDGAQLARWFHNAFDRVLLDAPCSGDGIIGKSRGQLAYWSPEDAVRKSYQQIGLLRAAFHMLRPGGTLVYSTCSLSTEENEEVLLGLFRRFGENAHILPADHVGYDVGTEPLRSEVAAQYPDSFRQCIRIWPHRHQTEGGFLARLGKRATTEWEVVEGDLPLTTQDFEADADHMSEYVQDRWGFTPQIPADQQLARGRRELALRPAISDALAQALPAFVRAGMRVGSLHKEHLYLSQQAVARWGDQIQDRRVDLSWPQVQQLFAHNSLDLPSPFTPYGEVICCHGPWQICRGLISRDGSHLTGFVPRGLRHANLQRLLP
ncbi:MAG: hypothetical protein CME24_04690 [Gemmatimonadetes bacterium]|nr:hypothetical protein [Gemmatimonadota bacterium]